MAKKNKPRGQFFSASEYKRRVAERAAGKQSFGAAAPEESNSSDADAVVDALAEKIEKSDWFKRHLATQQAMRGLFTQPRGTPEVPNPAASGAANNSLRPSKPWIHRIPVWREFGHWLKWGSASFAFALGMVGLGEYLIAEISLCVAMFCCISQIWVWQTDRHWVIKVVLALFTLGLGGFAAWDVFLIKAVGRWTHLPWERRQIATSNSDEQSDRTKSRGGLQSNTKLSDEDASMRTELHNDASRPLRDVAFHIKLNRQYSINEIGHFRVMVEIFDNQRLAWFMAIQDFYRPTYDPKQNPYGSQTNCYGYHYTVEYRTAKNRYSPIRGFAQNAAQQYGGLITDSPLVNEVQWQVDLYHQMPTYETLEDLNRKYLYVFVTDSIADKIESFSFQANNWELLSAASSKLTIIDDRPIAPWFLPLSKAEREIKWKGVYLKETDEVLAMIPSALKDKPLAGVWPLDFAMHHPRKLPEPEIKSDPLK